ncbi:hypothetical protein M413DRAFT_12761 [Hebeloma cylindrosporum]|uniref:Uncharacterized protein n=1 Tax=Hebeloma cylindrosporum TaxID=76867 RepID=A0A0C2XLG6_HEBCY|nr:hypothetical protein M413DRAFT_12761 [Hebeloma cylindrosporum h7]
MPPANSTPNLSKAAASEKDFLPLLLDDHDSPLPPPSKGIHSFSLSPFHGADILQPQVPPQSPRPPMSMFGRTREINAKHLTRAQATAHQLEVDSKDEVIFPQGPVVGEYPSRQAFQIVMTGAATQICLQSAHRILITLLNPKSKSTKPATTLLPQEQLLEFRSSGLLRRMLPPQFPPHSRTTGGTNAHPKPHLKCNVVAFPKAPAQPDFAPAMNAKKPNQIPEPRGACDPVEMLARAINSHYHETRARAIARMPRDALHKHPTQLALANLTPSPPTSRPHIIVADSDDEVTATPSPSTSHPCPHVIVADSDDEVTTTASPSTSHLHIIVVDSDDDDLTASPGSIQREGNHLNTALPITSSSLIVEIHSDPPTSHCADSPVIIVSSDSDEEELVFPESDTECL